MSKVVYFLLIGQMFAVLSGIGIALVLGYVDRTPKRQRLGLCLASICLPLWVWFTYSGLYT
ncbi:MAG: hypothetical protein OEZ19_08040 [Paracoccaceae bacterium]|nr:hypothetical protein [Paracoccaceae bacterium]